MKVVFTTGTNGGITLNAVETFRLIGAISRQATTDVNQEVSRYGLDNNLFLYLLRIIENDGITQSDLVNVAHVDKTTLSRALTKLEFLGYIEKKSHPQNKNFKQLFATQKGTGLYNTLFTIENNYVTKALANLSPAELLNLTKALETIQLNLK